MSPRPVTGPGPDPAAAVRVVVADDQQAVRDGFAALLDAQPGIEVVGVAADGAQAVAVALRTRPDVVVMDVRMPVLDGIAATRRLCAAPGGPRVLILTTFDLDTYVYEAIRAGAGGFLLKDSPGARLVEAVQVLAAGEALLAPSVTRRLIADLAARQRPVDDALRLALGRLTAREHEVLTLIGQGLSTAEIAERLTLATETVKTHTGRVFTKLGLRDRAQAVVVCYEARLLHPGGSAAPA